MTEFLQKTKDEILSLACAINKTNDLELVTKEENDNFFTQNQKIAQDKTLKIAKTESFKDFRALSDLAICYMAFHDRNIHNYEKNIEDLEEEEKYIIDDFEKMRLVKTSKDQFAGIAKNIIEKIDEDLDFALANSGYSNLQLILLHELFLSEPEFMPTKLRQEIANISVNFDQKIRRKITKIAKNYQNQQDFINSTKDFLQFLRENSQQQEQDQQDEEQKNDNNNEQEKQDQPSINQENIESERKEKDDESSSPKTEEIKDQEQKIGSSKSYDGEDFSQIKSKINSAQIQEDGIEYKNKYEFFTNKFDEIILPSKLVDKYELESLRQNLDFKMEKLESISKKLTIKLKKKLLAKQKINIEHSESEGILNRKKLSQIVANPFEQKVFIKENKHDYQDTIVTILLDNSGSMRGTPIVMSALASQILAEILEKFAIKTEIIGFTTADWKGGKSRKIWESKGRKKNPGRLNDLRHIIYKSANQSFKKAKNNLGLMLKEGILKENIDGEALLFAKSRLMQREENRKILMVISDGTPVDDSTNSANSEDILIDHLHHVVKKIEKENKIELVGIGIGHNVGEFYQNSITIKNIDELGDVMIKKLVDLI